MGFEVGPLLLPAHYSERVIMQRQSIRTLSLIGVAFSGEPKINFLMTRSVLYVFRVLQYIFIC